MRGNAQVVNAMVPLANMFGYVNSCAPSARDVPAIRCSSTITNRCRQAIAAEVQAKYA